MPMPNAPLAKPCRPTLASPAPPTGDGTPKQGAASAPHGKPQASRRHTAAALLALACVGLWGTGSTSAHAAPSSIWPQKSVRIMVAGPAGSLGDNIARVLAQHMGQRTGQTFVVDNRPGANSAVGAGELARAAPDGHTLLITNSSSITVNPQVYKKLSYDPSKLTPVTPITEGQFILAVNPAWAKTHGIDSVQRFVAWAKANPGKLRYASAGNGNLAHLTLARMANQFGFEATHVPYKGLAPAQLALMAGEVEAMFDIANSAPNFEAGKLLPLAITAPKRSTRLPNIPTMAEAGFAGFEVNYWMGVFVPTGTPEAMRTQIFEALQAAARDPRAHATLSQQGDVHTEPPAVFAKRIAQEIPMWGEVVRREKISLE